MRAPHIRFIYYYGGLVAYKRLCVHIVGYDNFDITAWCLTLILKFYYKSAHRRRFKRARMEMCVCFFL